MEIEGTFPDLIFESSPEHEKIAGGGSSNSPPANTGFDCSICLDFVSDPVVTLCGHLYCWSCIYRWLHCTSSQNPSRCPVCKSPLSDSSLVPLYGRGLAAKSDCRSIGIPRRPRDTGSLLDVDAAVDRLPYNTGILRSTAGVVLGEIAFAMLPWAFTNPPSSYLWPAAMGNPRWRRLERRAEIWLRQLWVFLLCFALLCLLFF